MTPNMTRMYNTLIIGSRYSDSGKGRGKATEKTGCISATGLNGICY